MARLLYSSTAVVAPPSTTVRILTAVPESHSEWAGHAGLPLADLESLDGRPIPGVLSTTPTGALPGFFGPENDVTTLYALLSDNTTVTLTLAPAGTGTSVPVPADPADDGKVVTAQGGALVLAAPTGGSAPAAGLGDYHRWVRDAAPDATSLGFDYVADSQSSSGTTIAADESSDWATTWGYPVAVVTETGTYTIYARVQATTPSVSTIYMMDPTGSNLPLPSQLAYPNDLGEIDWTRTLYLPADTHIELSMSGDTSHVVLEILRVA